jgi:hypothetical protein
MNVALFILLVVIPSFGVGYMCGRQDEWKRVLGYLHHVEDQQPSRATKLWWVAAGIAADEHRKSKSTWARDEVKDPTEAK